MSWCGTTVCTQSCVALLVCPSGHACLGPHMVWQRAECTKCRAQDGEYRRRYQIQRVLHGLCLQHVCVRVCCMAPVCSDQTLVRACCGICRSTLDVCVLRYRVCSDQALVPTVQHHTVGSHLCIISHAAYSERATGELRPYMPMHGTVQHKPAFSNSSEFLPLEYGWQ